MDPSPTDTNSSQPPYGNEGGAYPPQQYPPPGRGAYTERRYTYQSPPYDYRGPAYPPPRYIPPPSGVYNEDEYETYRHRRPEYPYYRYAPYGYGPREDSYRRYGYVDRY